MLKSYLNFHLAKDTQCGFETASSVKAMDELDLLIKFKSTQRTVSRKRQIKQKRNIEHFDAVPA
jgi:hypothetical protein